MTTKKLCMMAILTAMQIVLTRIAAIPVGEWLRISFGFLPTAVSGMLMGPVASMMVAGVADVLGTVLTGKSVLIGLTVTAVFDGLMYGLILWRHKAHVVRTALALLPMAVITSMLLNTMILTDAGFLAATADGMDWPGAAGEFARWIIAAGGKLPKWVQMCSRVIKAAVQYPVNVAMLFIVCSAVQRMPASITRM